MGNTIENESNKKKFGIYILIVIMAVFFLSYSIYQTYLEMVEEKKMEYKRTSDTKIINKDRSMLDIDQVAAIKYQFKEQEKKFIEKINEKDGLINGQNRVIQENSVLLKKLTDDIIATKTLLSKENLKMDNKLQNELKLLKKKIGIIDKKTIAKEKEKEVEDSINLQLPKIRGPLLKELNLDEDNQKESSIVEGKTDAIQVQEDVEIKPEFFLTNVELLPKEKKDEDKKNGEDLKKLEMDLMMGTVNATLLMGVDAPTSIGTTNSDAKDPLPVLLSVTSNAIIANNYSQDYKDCLILATATGNATSERAYLRLSKLSCVATNGKHRIEADVNGWVIGEDNKAGLSGHLVTKNGALIMRGLAAGFLQSLADISNSSPFVVSGNSGNTIGGTPSTPSGSSLANGIAGGAGSSFQTIANYYIDMAKGMYPIIEVKGGRKVQVLIKGGGLKIKKVPYNEVFVDSDYHYISQNKISIDY